MRIPFIGPAYNHAYRSIGSQRMVNFFLEPTNGGRADEKFSLVRTPGTEPMQTISVGAKIDSIVDFRGNLYAATAQSALSDAKLWRCTNIFGDIAPFGAQLVHTFPEFLGIGQIKMIASYDQLVVYDGSRLSGRVFVSSALDANNVPTAFTEANPTSSVGGTGDRFIRSMTYIDGYFVASGVGAINGPTDQFYVSAVNNALSWNAIDTARAESSIDQLEGVFAVDRVLWLLGTKTCEPWINSGGADFPFQRSQSGVLQIGCLDYGSVRAIGNSMYFLALTPAGAKKVVRVTGLQYEVISTPAIESILEDLLKTPSDAGITANPGSKRYTQFLTSAVYTHEGRDAHEFYAITIFGDVIDPREVTIVYDAMTNTWHERASNFEALADGSTPSSAHIVNCAHSWDGLQVLGSLNTGKLLRFTKTTGDSDGTSVTRSDSLVATPHVNKEDANAQLTELRIVGQHQSPVETSTLSTTLAVSVSRDGGVTFGAERSIGSVVSQPFRTRWRNLGVGRDLVLQLVARGSRNLVINGAYGAVETADVE